AIFLHLDLADLRSVPTFAETFLAQERRLDLLFNKGCVPVFFINTKLHLSGGVMISPPDQLTAQGYNLRTNKWST
ncbi:hypothetical protein DFH09DRAFT_955037, partial [Mycena vulgaris]